jgi:Fic/DOC family N-terminal/Fic/DOC family
MYVRKEAVLSSQIEGTQSSLQDLLAAEAHVLGDGRPRDVDEVVNYVSAMKHGLARLADLPVSVRLIREIHAELLRGVRGSRLTPGELRRSQNWIGPGGCTLAEATFVPPPPAEVPTTLGALETFLHQQDDLPLLVKIGLAHAQFQGNRPRWCYFLLRTISKADHSGKSAVPGIDRKDLYEIEVAVPPAGGTGEVYRATLSAPIQSMALQVELSVRRSAVSVPVKKGLVSEKCDDGFQ